MPATKLPFEFVPPSGQVFTGALPVGGLIARIYEVFPLLGLNCGGQMRIIAFITHSADIRQILDHIGVESEPPHISPARVPPLWDDCGDAQMDDGVQIEPDWAID